MSSMCTQPILPLVQSCLHDVFRVDSLRDYMICTHVSVTSEYHVNMRAPTLVTQFMHKLYGLEIIYVLKITIVINYVAIHALIKDTLCELSA